MKEKRQLLSMALAGTPSRLDRIELHDDPIGLRLWREDDAPAVYAACQDAEIQRWLPDMPRPYTHDDARAFVTGELGLGLLPVRHH